MMKKSFILMLIMCFIMAICLVACDDDGESSSQSSTESSEQSSSESGSESESESEDVSSEKQIILEIFDYGQQPIGDTVSIYTIGNTLDLFARVSPDDTMDKNVTWSSADPSVASVDENGLVTALKHGITTITVTHSSGVKKSFKVSVGGGEPITKVEITSYDEEIYVTMRASFHASVEPFGASSTGLVWSSSNPSVAIVEAGLASSMATVTGVSAGTAIITASAPSGVSASVTVTVKDEEVIPVELYVNGELWKTIYTSEITHYWITPEDPSDITTNSQSTQYFEGWYKNDDFTGYVERYTEFKTPSRIYAKMTDIDIDAFTYTVDGGKATITGYNGTVPSTLIIPSAINGTPVRAIGKFAFRNVDTIESLYVCEGIEVIEMQAFIGCSELYSVSIPDTIEEIGYYAFPYSRLQSANYGTCNYIGNEKNPYLVAFESDAFGGCVILKESCKLFLRDANSGGIGSFIIDGEGEYLCAQDGVLYNKDKTRLVCYPMAKGNTFELPASVTEIQLGAFEGSTLTSISVNTQSTSFTIKDGILYDKELTKIIFVPSGVSGALEIPEGVIEVDYFAFSRALYVTEITFLGNMTSIDKMAFGNCTMLESITIENSDIYETRDGVIYEKGSDTAYITPRGKQS